MLQLRPRSTLFPYTTLFRSQAGTVERVNVCATFKEQRDNAACLSDHSTMERRTSRTIATIEEVRVGRSEEHTSELQSLTNIVCRLLLENNKEKIKVIERPTA